MTSGNSHGVIPTAEDKQRLDILSKEINERLEEISNIISKTLGYKTDTKASKVSFEKSDAGTGVVVVEPGPVVITSRYCDPPGMCCPGSACPC